MKERLKREGVRKKKVYGGIDEMGKIEGKMEIVMKDEKCKG